MVPMTTRPPKVGPTGVQLSVDGLQLAESERSLGRQEPKLAQNFRHGVGRIEDMGSPWWDYHRDRGAEPSHCASIPLAPLLAGFIWSWHSPARAPADGEIAARVELIPAALLFRAQAHGIAFFRRRQTASPRLVVECGGKTRGKCG
jgi:hypothetical protein